MGLPGIQIGVSNRRPVKKNRRFFGFLTPVMLFRCGGGGDRRRQGGLPRFREIGPLMGRLHDRTHRPSYPKEA